ncbi:MAG: phosphatase PAP2 family protein [Clostridia bacterium]|nr:phosphatase PAP2 family protein [Clostridia bacterium]
MRTPFLDNVMLFITAFGDEMFFMAIAIFLFWCKDKYDGYYMLFVGFVGTQINQLLKVTFKVKRPWVLDKSFKPVERAVPAATGYSFPSGHTQSSVGTFGTVVATTKNIIIRVLCVLGIILVPFSRMYLGVHTPADVAVSFVIAWLLVIIFRPIIKAARRSDKTMRIVILIFILISIIQTVYMSITYWDATQENLQHGLKNSYKMLGAVLGLAVIFEMDTRFIRFETKAVWWAQILKVVLGLLLTVGIKELSYLLFGLIPCVVLSRLLSYFVMVIFAGAVWPLSFKWFSKLGRKK